MATILEERVSALEAQGRQLLEEKRRTTALPWYERWKGAFENDEMYAEKRGCLDVARYLLSG